ncbi:DNA-binding IclR family transcriptional regulator [Aeromicrobium sp. SORGH_AS981]|uniref:IclR family transcriptional regulator n=1 Tax=Aeromicrobium sp. SORGH_AS_0981 TaxID=3041802 RepID=UPI00285F2B59|nr:IclR family transcriptional regulator [Aeromicrobium sp. SORGH_AS_0981]MDR6117993.1 DNA-binding IclR family transcriptional regulator [Aeromicrobium sp. SORGH_AS_0981]
MNDTEPGLVQSVDRAAAILELLADGGTVGVSELSRALDVHRSTAFRLLATLETRHLVEQVEHRGAYRLGLGVLRLAGAVSTRIDLTRDAQQACEAMARRLDETTNVAILDDVSAVNITQAMGTQMVAVTRQYVGQRTPLHATSTGKVLLAHAGDDLLQQVLAAGLEGYTDRTLTRPDDLVEELDRVRRRGWASADAEWEAGTCAVAVPVRGADGRVVAALSVTAPDFRMPASGFADLAADLADGAEELGLRWGTVRPAHRPGAPSD